MSNHPVVVLGGGYAGLAVVRALAAGLRTPAKVLLVDQSPGHELVVQLHEVAAGSVPPARLRLPLEGLVAGASRLTATVTRIDVAGGRVETTDGELRYRWLVIALGSDANVAGIPGAAEHAMPLRRLADAERFRGRLTAILGEEPRGHLADGSRTIIIAGGGPTGVQLAGELASWRGDRPDGADWRIILIEAQPALLPRFPQSVGRTALNQLRRDGVEVLLDSPVAAIDAAGVVLATGRRIPSRLVAWGGGVTLPTLLREAGLPTRHGGLASDSFLRVAGASAVFAAGDCLSVLDVKGEPIPPSAQLATDAGRHVAGNILRAAKGQPLLPYQPNYVGETVSLGRRSAVARVGRATVSGLAGLAIRRFTEERYLDSIGGLKLLQEWSQEL